MWGRGRRSEDSKNFLDTCPVFPQGKYLVQLATGDVKGVEKTLLKSAQGMSNCVNGIPVVKGAIHYAWGDKEGGDKAMKSSSRAVGVMGGGVGGFLVGGPAGAVAGGVAGGLAMDGVTTGVDSAIHNEYRPSGTVAAVTTLAKGESESVSGDIVDLEVGTVMDVLAGLDAGEQCNKSSQAKEGKKQVSETLHRSKKERSKSVKLHRRKEKNKSVKLPN